MIKQYLTGAALAAFASVGVAAGPGTPGGSNNSYNHSAGVRGAGNAGINASRVFHDRNKVGQDNDTGGQADTGVEGGVNAHNVFHEGKPGGKDTGNAASGSTAGNAHANVGDDSVGGSASGSADSK